MRIKLLPLLALATLSLGHLNPLHAQTVDFSILGAFNGGPASATASIVFGSGPDTSTLQFDGIPPSSVGAPTFFSMGSFQSFATGLGATVTTGTTFQLFIYQTGPAIDMGELDATISGNIGTITSSVQLVFSPSTVTLSDNVQWSVLPSIVPVSPPTAGPSNFTGQVIVAPEPGSFSLLVCGGLVAAALVLRRRLSRA